MRTNQQKKVEKQDITNFTRLYHVFSSKGINFYAQQGKLPAYKGSRSKPLSQKQFLAKLYSGQEKESIGIDLSNNKDNIVCLDIDSSLVGHQIISALDSKAKRGFVDKFLIIETQTEGHLHLYFKNSKNNQGYLNFFSKNNTGTELFLCCGIKAELKTGPLTFYTPGRRIVHYPASLDHGIEMEQKHFCFCSVPFLPYTNSPNEQSLKDALVIQKESRSLVPEGERHNTLFKFLKHFKVSFEVVEFIRLFFFEEGYQEFTEKEAYSLYNHTVKVPRDFSQFDIDKYTAVDNTTNFDEIVSKENINTLNQENQTHKKDDLYILIQLSYDKSIWSQAFRKWRNVLDNYTKKLQKDFLNLKPYLPKWFKVFKRKTPEDTIRFILNLYEVYGIMLPCELWNGFSIKLTIMILYIHLTKEYLLYVEDTNSWHFWNGTYWVTTSFPELVSKVNNFVVKLQLSGLDSMFHFRNYNFINSMKPLISIKSWPEKKGINAKNGFFFINPKTGEYVLAPHSPGWFQKTIFGANINLDYKLNLFMNRWLLDLSNENRYAYINLLAFFRFCINPAGTSIIVNLNGPPRCGKTLIMEFLEELLPNSISYGSFDSLNSFQRKNLLVDKRVVAFPDANLKKLSSENIEFIKKLSGRDSIMVEDKGGDDYAVKTESLVVLISNNTYEEVEAFNEPALRDRTLNISIEGINSEVTVPVADLKKFIFTQDNLDLVFMLALGIPTSLAKKLNRGGESRSLVETDQSNFMFTWIQEKLLAVSNNVTNYEKTQVLGKELYEHFNGYIDKYNEDNYYRSLNKIKVFTSIKSFYREFDYCLNSLDPTTIQKKKTEKGIAYINLTFNYDRGRQTLTKLSSKIPKDLKEVYDLNPLFAKRLSITDPKGHQQEGKLLDPKKGLQSFDVHQQIKNTDLKQLIYKTPGFKEIHNFSHLPSISVDAQSIFFNSDKEYYYDDKMKSDDYQTSLRIESNLLPPFRESEETSDNIISKFLFSKDYLLVRTVSHNEEFSKDDLTQNLDIIDKKHDEFYISDHNNLHNNKTCKTLEETTTNFKQKLELNTEANFLYQDIYLGLSPVIDIIENPKNDKMHND